MVGEVSCVSVFFNLAFRYSATSSNFIRTSPSLQKCFHTHSPSPLPSAMLCFVVVLRLEQLSARADDVTDRQTESSNV